MLTLGLLCIAISYGRVYVSENGGSRLAEHSTERFVYGLIGLAGIFLVLLKLIILAARYLP